MAGFVFLHQGVLGDRPDQGSQADRCPDADHPGRRRPDRTVRRFRPAPGQTDQGCGTEGLQGRAARPLHHAQGPGERRSARLHPAQGSAPGCLAHDPEPWRRRTVCMLEHLDNHRRRFVGGAALTGDANGAPHPDQAVYAEKFSGKYDRRLIRGGIGHNLTEVAPRAFAQAVVDAARAPDRGSPRQGRYGGAPQRTAP